MAKSKDQTVRVTLRRSVIGEKPKTRATVEGLGLKRIVFMALLGGVVGLGLGVAAALALEFFNWSIRTPEDIEFYLGLPALAAVPALPAAPRPPELVRAPADRERQTDGR